VKPGEIANKERNRGTCAWLVARWAASLREGAGAKPVRAVRWEEAVVEAGETIGRQRVVLAADGRFRVEVVEGYDGAPTGTAWGFDGKRAWRQEPGEAAAEARHEPLESLAWRTLAALQGKDPLKAFKSVALEGGDRAQRQRAFRLRLEAEAGAKLLLWFSLFGPDGALQPRLLKVARDSTQKGADAALTFSGDRAVGGMCVPRRRCWVEGLEERVEREFAVASAAPLEAVPEALLKMPAAAKGEE
jgi:hypothetical protein